VAKKKKLQPKLTPEPLDVSMGCHSVTQCDHCGHGKHTVGRCPDETMNGYSCRCKL